MLSINYYPFANHPSIASSIPVTPDEESSKNELSDNPENRGLPEGNDLLKPRESTSEFSIFSGEKSLVGTALSIPTSFQGCMQEKIRPKNSSFLINDFALLDKLSTEEALLRLFEKNEFGERMIETLSFDDFSKIQLIRLSALKEIAKGQKLIENDWDSPNLTLIEPFTLLLNMEIDEGFRNIFSRFDFSIEERNAMLANFIELNQIPLQTVISKLNLNNEETKELHTHLRYLDLTEFQDDCLGKEIIQICLNFYTLCISNDKIVEGLQTLSLCTMLNCSECRSLTTLPELPLCTMLDCSKCTGLTTLPELPLCTMLDCSECTGLTTLPELPLCTMLDCSKCTGLTTLPELPLCTMLDCSDCRELARPSGSPPIHGS